VELQAAVDVVVDHVGGLDLPDCVGVGFYFAFAGEGGPAFEVVLVSVDDSRFDSAEGGFVEDHAYGLYFGCFFFALLA
jgi:hypothetical protein